MFRTFYFYNKIHLTMVNLHPIIKLSGEEFLTQIKNLVISIFKSFVKQLLSKESSDGIFHFDGLEIYFCQPGKKQDDN